MSTKKTNIQNSSEQVRYVLIGVLVVAAFFGAYRFASAASSRPTVVSAATAATAATTQVAASGSAGTAASAPTAAGSCCGGSSGSAASGGCCGGSAAASKLVAGTATVTGGVQRIDVKVTTQYSPNVITLKAGVPAEVNFSSAQGCTGIVQSSDLNFQEDLTTGPKTVKLAGLQPGTYDFACGMNMVHGQIVVQ